MNIQQLRAQIAALQDATMDENRNFRSGYDEGKFDALSAVDTLLDSLQEEPVSEQKLSNVQRTIKDWKEPVSEDLEKVAEEYALDDYIKPWRELVKRAFKDGAKWQKEQFEKNRLAACDRQTEEEAEVERDFVISIIEKEHRQPTFDDAIKYGMRLQKEQMMKGCFIPDTKLIEFKLGESYSFDSKGFDKEKAKAYGAKEGDTIVAYFFVKKT